MQTALQNLEPGTRVQLVDGSFAEVWENPRDGKWVVVRALGPDGEPMWPDQLAEAEDIAEIVPH